MIVKGHRKSVILGWSLTTVLLKFSKTSSRSDHLSKLSSKQTKNLYTFCLVIHPKLEFEHIFIMCTEILVYCDVFLYES